VGIPCELGLGLGGIFFLSFFLGYLRWEVRSEMGMEVIYVSEGDISPRSVLIHLLISSKWASFPFFSGFLSVLCLDPIPMCIYSAVVCHTVLNCWFSYNSIEFERGASFVPSGRS